MALYRSIDGSGNNGTRNAVGADFARLGDAHFTDGISGMRSGPNPRDISNIVVGEGDAAVDNPQGLSGMMYAWGQFLDHDVDLNPSDRVNSINITIPNGDPNFPDGSIIPMTRAVINPLTGAGTGTPATPVNTITGWVDGSMVYGSTAAVAASLRAPGGYLLTSDGDNLPIVNGSFLAGDVRAAENPSLTTLQTIFVREHNFQVDKLRALHSTWTDEHLYQEARAIVGAEIAHITYDEFLPHLLGPSAGIPGFPGFPGFPGIPGLPGLLGGSGGANGIARYTGYKPGVDPSVSAEFAGAAFRFGHSIVSDEAGRMDNHGAAAEEISLADLFFLMPDGFAEDGGADAFARNLASEPSMAMDGRIVDGLRNFLVDTPAGITMDLAAINIQRGRDLGLGTLNETRASIGLQPYLTFEQITNDAATVAALRQVFGDVNAVDLWTGGLSEATAPGAMLGQTFSTIIADQFEALRDGDRLWYERAGFDFRTLQGIKNTSLSDIIERTTDTNYLQDDAFVFYARHSGELGGVESEDPDVRQLVVGSAGIDTLLGGALGDILLPTIGGLQTLTGDAGADQFTFTENGINARITDFTDGQDRIVFDVGLGLGRGVRLSSVGGDAVIDFRGTHVVVEDTRPLQLLLGHDVTVVHEFLFA